MSALMTREAVETDSTLEMLEAMAAMPTIAAGDRVNAPASKSGSTFGRLMTAIVMLMLVGIIGSLFGGIGASPARHASPASPAAQGAISTVAPVTVAEPTPPRVRSHVATTPTPKPVAKRQVVRAPAHQNVPVRTVTPVAARQPVARATRTTSPAVSPARATAHRPQAPPVAHTVTPVAVQTPSAPAPATKPVAKTTQSTSSNVAYVGPKNAGDGTNTASVTNADQNAGGGASSGGATPTGSGGDVNVISSTQSF